MAEKRFDELSYASPDDPWWKRRLIRTIEALSGRHRFLPLYRIWQREIVGRSDRVMGDLLKLINVELAIVSPVWPPVVPNDNPLILIANHPFGIGDGIAALAIAEELGRPFKVLLHKDLTNVPEIKPYSLPVDFDETKEAMKHNIETKREALRLLDEGYTIVIFPAGGVATAHDVWGQAEELPWKMFTARMIMSAKASVLPVYFEGQNSWIFHFVSKFSATLRLSLLVSEFRRFAGSVCRVRVGAIVPFEQLEHRNDRKQLIKELYDRVHALSEREIISDPVVEDAPEDRRAGPIKGIRRLKQRASDLIPAREDLKRSAQGQIRKVGRLRRRIGERVDRAIPERNAIKRRFRARARKLRQRLRETRRPRRASGR